ncbi:MAG: hypothetical protein U0414_06875 [Polyangiaceae bacterium]
MRRFPLFSFVSFSVVTGLAAALSGCDDAASDGTGSSSSGSSMSSSGTGGGGGSTPSCAPSAGKAIEASCGVFVQTGAAGDGSRAAPFGSIKAAVAGLGDAKAIYVCGSESYTGSLTVPSGVSIIGGLSCNDWVFDEKHAKPEIVGDPNIPAVLVDGSGSAAFESIRIRAVDATTPSASSIALLVHGATLSIAHSELAAGAGAAGLDGTDAPDTNTATGKLGSQGGIGCAAQQTSKGGPETEQICDGAVASIGGKGGDGTFGNGMDGAAGQTGAAGQGGKGEVFSGWSCAVGGANGGGANGATGTFGAVGAGGVAKGMLTQAGFTPARGGDGGLGLAGQGGGGGGASKGSFSNCGGMPGMAGPGGAGGGGGTGGCGGKAGTGGGGGGASFAIAVIDGHVSLVATKATSATGGAGGDGGSGQPGAPGGLGGYGGSAIIMPPGCNGGNGGSGGNGGGGGGGRGGHSAPVVYMGNAPTIDAQTTLTKGSSGAHGVGQGNGADPAEDGADGSACAVLDFTGATEACSKN